MIPLKINNKNLCEIFEPNLDISNWSDDAIKSYSISKKMFPTEVNLTSETYSRDADRTADYELEKLTLVNRKAKPVFTWSLIPVEYVRNLFSELEYDYDFKDINNIVIPRQAKSIPITYIDFIGERTISAYLGQTIDGTLVEYSGEQYWENLRIAFPER